MFNFSNAGKQKQALSEPNPAQTPENSDYSGTSEKAASFRRRDITPQQERRLEEIKAQAARFAAENPNFDMREEIKNSEFIDYLWDNNLSVEDAFLLVHRDDIMDQVRTEAIKEFNARSNRIPENGAGKNRPAIASKNPKDLSDEEIDDIIERAKNGERITF